MSLMAHDDPDFSTPDHTTDCHIAARAPFKDDGVD
jgi:hypothetical protein